MASGILILLNKFLVTVLKIDFVSNLYKSHIVVKLVPSEIAIYIFVEIIKCAKSQRENLVFDE